MNPLFKILIRLGILKNDLDYHLIRASMVIIFLFLDIRNGLAMRLRA